MIRPTISLWQPWASLLFVPDGKIHETRHWAPPQRLIGKEVLIHAGGRKMPKWEVHDTDSLGEISILYFGSDWRGNVPYGAVIGSAVLSGFFRIDDELAAKTTEADRVTGNWTPGRYAWRLDDRRLLDEPVPWKGQQGWFSTVIPDPL